MYQLFGAATLAKWFLWLSGGFSVLTMLGALAFGRATPEGGLPLVWWFWTSLSTGATAGALILFGLGSTGFFPKLCRLRPLCGMFPDLDGTWSGTLESNWPLISAQLPGPSASSSTIPVPAALKVKARLLSIHLSLETDSRYSDSETVLVGINKSGGDVPCLTYVYRNRTPRPVPTDSGDHHGAARLELRDEDGVPTLRGVYWTDRNWQKGLNTAGVAVFRKSKEGASPRETDF